MQCQLSPQDKYDKEVTAADILQGELNSHKIMNLVQGGMSVYAISSLTGISERVLQDMIDSYEGTA